jgi:copper chaperone
MLRKYANKNMQSKTLDVKGMTCGHFKMSVEGALKGLEGVSAVEVDLNAGKVDVT